MAQVTEGMNVEEVKNLGATLQRLAQDVQGLVGRVDRSVQGSLWAGQDAIVFKHQWWPQHRGRLTTVAADLYGFGKSALNNATEQLQTSAAGGAGGATGTTGPGTGPKSGGGPNILFAGLGSGLGILSALIHGKSVAGGSSVSGQLGQAGRSGSFTAGPVQGSGSVSGAVGSWDAGAQGKAGIGPTGAYLGGSAQADASLIAVGAAGSLSAFGITDTAQVSGDIGVHGNAQADGKIGPDGASANVGAGGFAGAQAGASGSTSAFGASASGSASVRAGIGAEGDLGGSASLDKVGVKGDFGVTLGLGFDVKFDVSVSPIGVLHSVGDAGGGIVHAGGSALGWLGSHL